jgi:hypothetical protein
LRETLGTRAGKNSIKEHERKINIRRDSNDVYPSELEINMVTLIEWTAILSALAGVSATVFILLQLRHMDKHRDLEISMKLFEWAETDRLRKAFRWVENEFQFKDLTKYKAEVEKNFEVSDYPYQVEAFFEEVGFLVNKKFVDIDVIVDRLGAYIISNWKKLEPWILASRKERGDETFGEHFQKLYEKTIKYMKRT